MTTNKAKTFAVEMTLGDITRVSNLIREAYESYRYAAEREIAEDAEEGSWERRNKENALARRAELAELHARLFGEELTDES